MFWSVVENAQLTYTLLIGKLCIHCDLSVCMKICVAISSFVEFRISALKVTYVGKFLINNWNEDLGHSEKMNTLNLKAVVQKVIGTTNN